MHDKEEIITTTKNPEELLKIYSDLVGKNFNNNNGNDGLVDFIKGCIANYHGFCERALAYFYVSNLIAKKEDIQQWIDIYLHTVDYHAKPEVRHLTSTEVENAIKSMDILENEINSEKGFLASFMNEKIIQAEPNEIPDGEPKAIKVKEYKNKALQNVVKHYTQEIELGRHVKLAHFLRALAYYELGKDFEKEAFSDLMLATVDMEEGIIDGDPDRKNKFLLNLCVGLEIAEYPENVHLVPLLRDPAARSVLHDCDMKQDREFKALLVNILNDDESCKDKCKAVTYVWYALLHLKQRDEMSIKVAVAYLVHARMFDPDLKISAEMLIKVFTQCDELSKSTTLDSEKLDLFNSLINELEKNGFSKMARELKDAQPKIELEAAFKPDLKRHSKNHEDKSSLLTSNAQRQESPLPGYSLLSFFNQNLDRILEKAANYAKDVVDEYPHYFPSSSSFFSQPNSDQNYVPEASQPLNYISSNQTAGFLLRLK